MTSSNSGNSRYRCDCGGTRCNNCRRKIEDIDPYVVRRKKDYAQDADGDTYHSQRCLDDHRRRLRDDAMY